MQQKRTERILIVEDDPGVAELQQLRLERAGFLTDLAHTADQVRAHLLDHDVELIILDYRLPGNVNGLELHSQLKAAGHDVPVILVTGYGNEALAIQALRTGVRDFVSKSVEYLDYLPEAVGRVLNQVRTERQLVESENRFRSLLLSAPDAMIVSDKAGRIVFVNQMAEKMFGHAAADIVHRTVETLVPESHRAHHLDHRRRFLENPQVRTPGTRTRQMALRSNGNEFPIEIGLSLIEFGEGELILANICDVTEVCHLEIQMRDSNQVLEEIAAGFPLDQVLWTLTTSAERSHVGMRCSIMILDREQLRLKSSVAPSLPQAYMSAIDGTPVSESAGSCGAAAFLKRRVIVTDIATHPNWQGFRELAETHDLRACWSEPIVNSTGQVFGTFAMYYSEPREPSAAELEFISRAARLAAIALEQRWQADAIRLKEEQLRQSQKMEAVGALAGGIAHEFNNLLQVIRGYTEFVAEAIPEGHTARQDLAFVMDAAQRAMNLTRQLLYFGRRQALERTTVDPNQMIRDLLQLLRPLIGENIEVRLSCGQVRGAVHIDADQFQQALMNLCINSRDAMPQGGTLSITTLQVFLDQDFCDQYRHPTPGDNVQIAVTDTGTGMSAEVLARVFEPFFTTKEVGKGTGLGMSMVYGMVQQHAGSIQIESELQQGTTVRLYLPLVEAQPFLAVVDDDKFAQRGSQTILLAEDEPLVASYVDRVLQHAGYQTLLARDGVEAVTLFEAHASTIDLALLDVVMPKMNGREVCERLRQINPRLPIIFCTGYDPDSSQTGFVGQHDEQVITKPCTSQVLLSTIADTLAARTHD